MPSSSSLNSLLKKHFGFDAFRPYQEDVCVAVVDGHDSLLVMPTGAGKSLCYQLPALARNGTSLVISPLVALMEDQVAKLQAWGLRAERIHSGRDRSESRLVCEAYLRDELDFLFIAPERLAVPGFAEMLAKRRLSLIAVDEAHCISQWGHDFRPEYRMLGARLPLFREGPEPRSSPTPVLALTATATPRVQKDILGQLGLPGALTFIHGFRRDNIAISVAQVPQGERSERILESLEAAESRPAIVYASTRKSAELLAKSLGQHHKVALYHAGLSKDARDRTQAAFQKGEVEVMVATIAFGMGIDKSNIRTVIHASLPSSLEGYYQEIGRAGRDGRPSSAILMWSYADRKMHEFLHEKNYPPSTVLEKIAKSAAKGAPENRLRESLKEKSGLDADLFDAAVEKLWIHGGLRIDADEVLHPGPEKHWKPSYERQIEHRLEQMRLMSGFAEGRACRMLHLVRHFGDEQDSGKACEICDICAPDLSGFRVPTLAEVQELSALLALAVEREGQSLGRIHREGAPKIEKKKFDAYLAALERAGFVALEERSFEKDAREIKYLTLRAVGAAFKEADLIGRVKLPEFKSANKTGKKPQAKKAGSARVGREAPNTDSAVLGRVATLKEWRLAKARSQKAPAFTVLSDKTLLAVAVASPANLEELESVHGMGPKLVDKHGKDILKILENSSR